MDQSMNNDSTRKVNLEDLSKEDLVKKCSNLLLIAQKAKQAKCSLQEENNRLKEIIDKKTTTSNTAAQELIESLTQQKLSLITNVEDLKTQNESLNKKLKSSESELAEFREKLSSCDNENISYCRQIKRLTNENEQLITDLDALEKQINKLKEIGAQQHKQLLEVEKANSFGNEVTANELQRMLSISLEEVKRLKSDNTALGNKVENMEINLAEKDKSIIIVSEELKIKNRNVDNLTEELKLLKETKESEVSELEENINILKNNNEKLKEKVKLYHSKIIKFATTAKHLREDKNKILDLFKSYIDQVKNWKDQLKNCEVTFIKHISSLDLENQKLKELLEKHEKSEITQEQHTILLQKLEDIELINSDLSGKIEDSNKKIETLIKENQNLIQTVEEKQMLENKLKEAFLDKESELKIIRDEFESEKIKLSNRYKEMEESNLNLAKSLEESCNTIKNLEDCYEGLKEEKDCLEKQKQETEIETQKMREEIISLKNEVERSFAKEEIDETKIKLRQTELDLQNTTTALNQYKEDLQSLQSESEKIKKELANEIDSLQNEITCLRKSKDDLSAEIENLTLELTRKNDEINETTKKIQHYETLFSDLQSQIRSLEELGKRSGEEIKKLAEENKHLLTTNETLQDELNDRERSQSNLIHSYSQTDEMSVSTMASEEQIADLRRENAELLSEMNEMNQAIKERGESISKLQAHCEEVVKKLHYYEAQANKNIDNITEKERIIEELSRELQQLRTNKNCDKSSATNEEIVVLKNEIECLKEKLNANLETSYNDNDTMSTSTISKTEEMNRLKDLEGSWEERYGKLRNLAVKLKGKIRELTQTVNKQQEDNEELHKKLALNIKTIQNLQNQSDKLEDELDSSKKECKQYVNRLNAIANDISRDKQSLAGKDEAISELKRELEACKKEKQATETWKKQVSAKIQTLRKEIEANNLIKNDFETKLSKLSSDLEAKEQMLKAEMESHKHTKTLLDQSNNECKKNSVLSLEMQDYERSVKETSKKLEKQLEEISKLKGQVESQKTTITALREQKKLLEERLTEEEQNTSTAVTELNSAKKKITSLECEILERADKIHSLTQLLETNRCETEELSTELSKVIAEHQKANNALKNERDSLRSQMLGLQQSLREVQDNLKLKTDELAVIHKEYEGYKVRAQSVLRQNQSRDVGLEEKMSEEVARLTAQSAALKSQLEQYKEKIESLEVDHKNLICEREVNLKKLKELEGEIEELKNQYADLSAKHEKTISDNAETVRSLKVHADTLSQCYRQQISEQEVRHNREIIELQSRLEKAPSPTESPHVLPTMTREEGEGSESIESNLTPTVHPVPLERLLGSDSEQEIDRIKKKLGEEESKVIHLTALLSDTEQDLVKHVQMNKLLKEEIRRQQRSEEREKHAENLEYLKNVVFKFVTLNSGDERTRLVPVLNTILKLSPDETKQLNMVAKGETSLKGWTNYLPTWSSTSKPQ